MGITDIDASAVVVDEEITLAGPQGAFSLEVLPGAAVEQHTEVIDSGITAQIESVFREESEGSIEFELALDAGTNVEVLSDDDGNESVVLTSESGDFLGGVATAEATDATGASLKVSFATDGDTIQQVLSSESGQIAYPANVTTYAGTVWYSSGWVTTNPNYIVNVNPTALGRQQNALNVHKYHLQHAKAVLGTYNVNKYWNWGIEHQFLCHVVGAWFPSGVYNMESWQPALHWNQIANPWDRCNRIK